MLLHRHARIKQESIENALAAGQSDGVVFLPARTASRKVAESLAALANGNGGLLLLGVTGRGGIQAGNDPVALRELADRAGMETDPPLILPAAQEVAVGDSGDSVGDGAKDGARLVAVQVPPGLPQLYSVDGRYLVRSGERNRGLTTAELRVLLLERGEAGFEVQPVAGASLKDLDGPAIQRYLERIAAPPDAAPVDVLASKGCVAFAPNAKSGEAEWLPTAAGLLLFGRDPQRFLRSGEIICVRYAGSEMGDEFERRDIRGTLVEQIRQAETFVQSNMRRGMRIAGMAREESTEYPIAVVREAIVNAIAHRDYSIRGEGIRLLMFSDRLQIYSPGRLPGHVTLENLVEERFSRNEAIVAVLTDYGYIERLGYGIDRMIAAMQEAGLAAPLFEELAAGFQVTLQSEGSSMVSADPASQPWAHGFLNERQEKALAHLQVHGRITNSDYQNLVPDVSPETIRRDLVDLVEKNLLLKIGAKRATYYILK